MKILHLLQSSRFSGAENVVCQIIKMSEQFDNAEMVYCSVDGQIKESLKERNITFVPISELSISEVKRVISEQKPDLIHAHDRSACITAALASGKIPVIAHMHVNNNKGFSLFLKNTIWTLFSRKYRHIFWVSDSAYEQFQFKKLLKSKSSVLYNVIDINELYKKVEEDKNTYDYDIVYVGRLSYQKNPERLMQVLQQVVRKKNNVKKHGKSSIFPCFSFYSSPKCAILIKSGHFCPDKPQEVAYERSGDFKIFSVWRI